MDAVYFTDKEPGVLTLDYQGHGLFTPVSKDLEKTVACIILYHNTYSQIRSVTYYCRAKGSKAQWLKTMTLIYFVHSFAAQSSAGGLGSAPQGVTRRDSTGSTSRWHSTGPVLAAGSTQRGHLHRVAWASLQNGGWGSRLRVPKRQEGEVTSFIAWVEKLDNRPPVLCRPINGDSRARGPDSTSQRKER